MCYVWCKHVYSLFGFRIINLKYYLFLQSFFIDEDIENVHDFITLFRGAGVCIQFFRYLQVVG